MGIEFFPLLFNKILNVLSFIIISKILFFLEFQWSSQFPSILGSDFPDWLEFPTSSGSFTDSSEWLSCELPICQTFPAWAKLYFSTSFIVRLMAVWTEEICSVGWIKIPIFFFWLLDQSEVVQVEWMIHQLKNFESRQHFPNLNIKNRGWFEWLIEVFYKFYFLCPFIILRSKREHLSQWEMFLICVGLFWLRNFNH